MEYKLKIQPAVIKKGLKYKVIQITDISLHTSKKTPTPSVGKKIERAFKNDKPDRIYSPIKKDTVWDNRTLTLDLLTMDPYVMKMVQEEEAKGYKFLIALPNESIPVMPGSDTVEFMNSKNGKRIIRGLAKKNSKD